MNETINGKHSITGDTALRLGHWFGMNPQVWMNLQAQYDLASTQNSVGNQISQLPQKLETL